jgi:hypothetical protein
LGGLGSKGAIFFHCASVSNGPDRAIGPPSALLTLLISHFRLINHSHFNGLFKVVQQLLVPLPCLMTTQTHCGTRRHQRISLPNGMSVAWYGGGDQQISRVKTLGMGGVFLSGSRVRPVGSSLRLVFEVPGGIVQAEAIVRSVSPGEGMGVEFTNMNPQDRVLLERLLKRLLS